jgi:adenylate cyclase
VIAAVECAGALQQGMGKRNRDVPRDRRIDFGMDINLDEVIADGKHPGRWREGRGAAGDVRRAGHRGSVFGHVKNRLDLRFEDLGISSSRLSRSPSVPSAAAAFPI